MQLSDYSSNDMKCRLWRSKNKPSHFQLTLCVAHSKTRAKTKENTKSHFNPDKSTNIVGSSVKGEGTGRAQEK